MIQDLIKINQEMVDVMKYTRRDLIAVHDCMERNDKSILRMIEDLDRRLRRIETEFSAHMEGHI